MSFTQIGPDINGEAADDHSGYSVSLSSDGSVLAIGAPYNQANGFGSGHTRIYQWDSASSSWNQRGSDIDGEAGWDSKRRKRFSLQRWQRPCHRCLLQRWQWHNFGPYAHLQMGGSSWNQRGSDIDGEAACDKSGNSVSLSSDGSVLAIGAYLNDGNGTSSGHTRIYAWNQRLGSTW